MSIWAAIPLVTCLAYAVVFSFAIQRVKKKVNRVFVYYLGLAAFWSFTSFMVRQQADPELSLFWNRILAVSLVAGLVVYFHFVRLYTGRSPGWGVYLGYVCVPVLIVISITTDWVIKSSHVDNGLLHHELGGAIYVIGALSLLYTFSVLYLLGQKYLQSKDPIDRNRTAYLLAGWGVMAPLAYTNLIPELKGLPLDHIGSFINVAVIAYAITRYNLLDIRLIARRGLGWLVMAVLFSGVYAGLTYLGLNYLPDVTPGVIYTFASIIIVFLSITGRPIRKAIEAGIDRLIYQRAYNHREALVDFTRNMVGNLNLEELANELLPMLANALGISCSYLLLKDGDTGEFRSHFIFPRPEQDEISALMVFDQDSPIIHWLDKHKEHLNTAKIDQLPQFKALWKDERDQLEKKGIQLLFPIKSADKLVAVLALSSKGKKCLYSAEDISILEGIASQVGVMLQNAQLYTFAIIKANTDELTGLYNHRHFHERLEQEIARNSRFGGTFSLIILDIDLFKVYNDIYGHLAGDQVLRKMGKYIQASIRNIDLAFRYGGEEFTIILPEANAQDAFKVAERIRKTIEANTSLRAMPITASIGIANWPNDGIMREEIISAADTALYQSKNNGRNRTSYACDVLTSSVDSLPADMTSYSRSISIIYALAATVDAKDSYTYGHSRKVSDYAVSLAEQIHLPDNQINIIRAAGLLHDIGKIGIADSILNKNGSLDTIEWKAIKTHPEIGVEILRHIHELADCMPLILHHHERYDGKGYPAGLMGENIPQGARILSIADAYDAMTTARPYRGRMSCEDALLTLKKNSGTQFDSYLVEIFCEYIRLNQPESSPA